MTSRVYELVLIRLTDIVWHEPICIQSANDEDNDCRRLLDLRCHLDSADSLDFPMLCGLDIET